MMRVYPRCNNRDGNCLQGSASEEGRCEGHRYRLCFGRITDAATTASFSLREASPFTRSNVELFAKENEPDIDQEFIGYCRKNHRQLTARVILFSSVWITSLATALVNHRKAHWFRPYPNAHCASRIRHRSTSALSPLWYGSMSVLFMAPIFPVQLGRLGDEIRTVAHVCVDWIHVDVMHGHCVPNITSRPSILKSLCPVV